MSNLLEVKDLAISFSGIKAVNGLSFNLEKGEVLGLIGPNGSGKSTTVNLISNVYRLDAGEITFDGIKLNPRQSIAERSALGIGRTFQSPKPFANLTVYNNIYTIALLRRSAKQAAEKTQEILEMTKLLELRDTPSGKLPIEKRKWMDLARVLATDPKLIMMDEVMAGLNPTEMEESLDLVRTINKEGITIMFIEHVIRAVVSVCTRVIVLNEGKLLYEGKPLEALNDQRVVEAYIGKGREDAAN